MAGLSQFRAVAEPRGTKVDMTRTVDFYFDFLSPFAYLAHGELIRLCHEYGWMIAYKPIDLDRVKKAAGNTGPSNREIPVKLRYLMVDIRRWAARYGGLPVQFPKNLVSERMNIGTFYAQERNQAEDYVREGFKLGWGEGGDLNDDALLARLAGTMGWSADEFLAYLVGSKGRAAFDRTIDEAIRRGVFGVPTMMIGDEMWWGNDRLFFVAEIMARGTNIAVQSNTAT